MVTSEGIISVCVVATSFPLARVFSTAAAIGAAVPAEAFLGVDVKPTPLSHDSLSGLSGIQRRGSFLAALSTLLLGKGNWRGGGGGEGGCGGVCSRCFGGGVYVKKRKLI